MTDQAYKSLSHAEQVFKDIVWTPMLTLGENWLEAEVPFFALPVIKQLDEAAIKALTDILFNQMVEFIDVSAIRLVNTAHQAAYDKESERLVIIAAESGVTSDAYKKAQNQALIDMAKFTHIGP